MKYRVALDSVIAFIIMAAIVGALTVILTGCKTTIGGGWGPSASVSVDDGAESPDKASASVVAPPGHGYQLLMWKDAPTPAVEVRVHESK